MFSVCADTQQTHSDQSCPWVGSTHLLGWVEIFLIFGGCVGSWVRNGISPKIKKYTFTESIDTDGHGLSAQLGWGLGWVLGPHFHYGMDRVGLDRSFRGLGRRNWTHEQLRLGPKWPRYTVCNKNIAHRIYSSRAYKIQQDICKGSPLTLVVKGSDSRHSNGGVTYSVTKVWLIYCSTGCHIQQQVTSDEA